MQQVLRPVFLLLLLANLLLFAWGRGYFGATGEGEGKRLADQIAPDRLRIAAKGSAPAAPAPPVEVCRALSGLEREAAGRLSALLAGRDAQLKIEQRVLEEPSSWWVYIPPLPNAAQAERKAAELSRLGIKDFYVVRESGPNQFAVSLGLFRSEEGAKEYLATLQKKTVKSARILARESAGSKALVEVRASADRLAKAFEDLPPEFAAAQGAECARGGQ